LSKGVGVSIQRAIRLSFKVSSATVLRVGFQFPVEGGEGLLELVYSKVRKPQIEINFGVLGRSVQHLLESFDGFRKLQFRLVNDTQSFENLRLVGVSFRRFEVNLFRSGIIIPLFSLGSLPQVFLGALGLGHKRAAKSGKRNEGNERVDDSWRRIVRRPTQHGRQLYYRSGVVRNVPFGGVASQFRCRTGLEAGMCRSKGRRHLKHRNPSG